MDYTLCVVMRLMNSRRAFTNSGIWPSLTRLKALPPINAESMNTPDNTKMPVF